MAAPAWEQLVRLHDIQPARTLVVGAGRAHDALWFASRGFDTTAIDFAPSAVAVARDAASKAQLPLTVREFDVFALDPAVVGRFGLVVEHTCFCAIDPSRRAEYVAAIARVTEPGGLFVAVFFWRLPPGGPPFATSETEVRALFEPAFEVLRLEPNPASVPDRAGAEGWGVFRRR